MATFSRTVVKIQLGAIATPTFFPSSTKQFHNFSWFFCIKTIAFSCQTFWVTPHIL
ncbi:MAG: hypothetical protein QNJ54_36840 [Prochloraceae cyanobacterium]|nr:hypothetical protein [Prochloraceae cyanobacterium]